MDQRQRASRLHLPDHRLAVDHGVVRQFRRGRCRGTRQGASGEPASDPRGDQGQAHRRWQRPRGAHPGRRTPAGTGGSGRSRRPDPLGRRGDRGRRLSQRGGHHRKVGAGHSRGRRRPVCGHRRHAGGLRLAQGAHHRGTRLDVSRSHDQAGRGCRAPEDAERDRAQYPARGHDADLRLRHGDDPELCRLRQAARSRSSSSLRCS